MLQQAVFEYKANGKIEKSTALALMGRGYSALIAFNLDGSIAIDMTTAKKILSVK